jgi:uncharacterized protein YndB with AHSA1/START domain
MARFWYVFLIGLVLTLASPTKSNDLAIRVTPVRTEKGDVVHVKASIRINASPETVWEILSDCARAPQLIPHLQSCRIVERDPRGRWDIREHIIKPPFLPTMRTLVRNEFVPPKRLSFRLLSGDMKVSDGAWTLRPEGTETILAYDAHVAPNFAAPQFLVANSISNDFPRMLHAIAHASQSARR